MTLLTFNSKYVIASAVAVTTTSATLVDDTEASQTFNLDASKVVLVIYQANNVYGAAMPSTGMQNAISIDTVDKANSWDCPYEVNYPVRNTVFWLGTLAAGSHTIKGRFASRTSGSTATVSNRVLLIYIFDGDEFQYVDDATTATTPNTTFIDDPNAQVTFTPSATCKALVMYNCANSGATESQYGKKAAINIAGTDYGQAEKSNYGNNYVDSVFTVHALSLSAVSTTVKGRFANAGLATTVTIHRRQLAVLLLDDSTLMDVVTSTTQVSTTSNALVDDAQATISRTTPDTKELLVVAMGTKRYGISSNAKGECYGIKINTNDRTTSRGCPYGGSHANSAATTYAEQLASGDHTVQGRFSNNYGTDIAKIDARQVVALWLTVAAGGQTYTVNVSEPSISASDSISYNMRRDVAVFESLGTPSDSIARVLYGYRTISEPSISVSDSPTAGLFRALSISEVSITVSDSTIYVLRRDRSLSEPTITVSDGVIRVFWGYRMVSEPSISASDDVSTEKISGLVREVNEPAISVSDVIVYFLQRIINVSEPSISMSDDVLSVAYRSVSISEVSVGVSDSTGYMFYRGREIAESLGLVSDGIGYTVRHVVSVSEPTISVSDVVYAGIFGKVVKVKIFLIIGDLAIQLTGA